ncbi:hypothetical protein PSECIP111951_03390 [Pseudoalteromonas holothuriae]|uniref:Uncharacterized protein n=1 Tax=Pseudoalteromonas holothuriae TaxID=2963714 RepID=A0ABM9GLU0_9GAMM|nr:hypothetical protein [Pseudoalteromonas sp. CIP111951]CAH9065563.1 hypothetical protein PSECIP111951_03390 [Pseudoalteromonas sp. CIP111951]
MGIRSALKKELMNLDSQGLMTADDVRHYLQMHLTRVKDKNMHCFNLIARFNTHHNQVQSGLLSQEIALTHEQHRLFKEVLYPKSALQKWLAQQ